MNALIPNVRAVMKWRILTNFRVEPEVAARLLPEPFRPKIVNGWAMAGICLIRLEQMRPVWMPRVFGVASENAAHRIAVEWTENGSTRDGVFIPRRDTNSLLNHIAGGRLFPGVHHRAHFRSTENDGHFEINLSSVDGETGVNVAARITDTWPAGSVFKSLAEASAFFQTGGCGWSPSTNCALEGVQLHTDHWAMHPLAVERAESSFFSDEHRFPAGSVQFDSALLMRGIHHEWRALGKFTEPPRVAHNHHGTAAFFELP
ncbi:MAG TPA: DUF2071 domain-containing protein [Verrucomicrobiota bacterium]|nr:DUF2071 domain-containing protein [Verrucomicrobiota bacterium]